jgi:hypothetical protein
MLYPPKAQNPVGDAPNLRTSSFHDGHFKAIVVIQVNARGSQHFILGLVLRLDQTLQKLRAVVVVDHGQGPHNRPVFLQRERFEGWSDW